MKRMLGITALMFISLPLLLGAAKYGDAVLKKGSFTIIRDSKLLMFAGETEQVEIMQNDLLRVGQNSRVNLFTSEKTIIEMGSNALFLLRFWKEGINKGHIRMLFGIARVKTSQSQAARDKFLLKTPMAEIEIQGTAWLQVASTGNTCVVTEEGLAVFKGIVGSRQLVEKGEISLVVNGGGAILPIKILETIREEIAAVNVSSIPANHAESSALIGEIYHLTAGRIEQEELEQSKNYEISIDDNFDLSAEQAASETVLAYNESSFLSKVESLAAGLEQYEGIEVEDIEPDTEELGFILGVTTTVDIFSDFYGPQLPGMIINVDDLVTTNSKIGNISIEIEK